MIVTSIGGFDTPTPTWVLKRKPDAETPSEAKHWTFKDEALYKGLSMMAVVEPTAKD